MITKSENNKLTLLINLSRLISYGKIILTNTGGN